MLLPAFYEEYHIKKKKRYEKPNKIEGLPKQRGYGVIIAFMCNYWEFPLPGSIRDRHLPIGQTGKRPGCVRNFYGIIEKDLTGKGLPK